MILVNVTKSHAIDAFYLISRTCKRFEPVIEEKKDEIQPMVHINFPENIFQNLPGLAYKILVAKRKHNRFITERAFWKQRQNIQSVNLLQQSDIID